MEYYLRKARVQDMKDVHRLIMGCYQQGLMLPRSLSELYAQLRDYYVLAPQERGPVAGCCALSIAWEDLAEVRSLAVISEEQGKGWGAKLVEACLSEAVTLGLYRVFALTYQVAFFGKLGFVEVGKDKLPQKVWGDCLKCPKFPECDETAMIMEM